MTNPTTVSVDHSSEARLRKRGGRWEAETMLYLDGTNWLQIVTTRFQYGLSTIFQGCRVEDSEYRTICFTLFEDFREDLRAPKGVHATEKNVWIYHTAAIDVVGAVRARALAFYAAKREVPQ